ncbi:hypothetical protein KJ632_02270 [Patescibacteria group bacterium]|nr:hypothetical protein [Patescibacteria group bacterium]
MKKIVLLIFVLSLSACSLPWFGEGEEIASMEFNFSNGAVSPPYFYEGKLLIEPDYEDRALVLNYQVTYPYRSEETVEEDFSGDGFVGGEFFDRFEEIVVDFVDGEQVSTYGAECVGGSNMKIVVTHLNGDLEEDDIYMCGERDEQTSMVENFYNDVLNLFEEDVY